MDQLYYESGYIVEGYYTYVADAASTIESTSTVTCDAEKIVSGVVVAGYGSLESFATIECTLSHLYGADLFALSDTALEAAVDRIRDNNISVTSAYTITADAERTRLYSAAFDSVADFSVDNLRVRNQEADFVSAFSIYAEATRLAAPTEFNAGLSSEFTQVSTAKQITSLAGSLESTTDLSATGLRIQSSDVALNSAVTLTAENSRTRDNHASLTNTTTTAVVLGIVKEFAVNAGALFTPTANIVVTVNSTAVLDSTSTMTITAGRFAPVAASLSANVQLSLTPKVTKTTAVAISSTSTISAINVRTRRLSASVSTAFTQTTNNTRTRNNPVIISTASTLVAVNKRTRSTAASASTAFTQTTSAKKTVFVQANTSSAFVQSTNAVKKTITSAGLSTNFQISATGTRVFQLSASQPISGVVLGNREYIELDASTSSPTSASEYLISFWAENPSGAILDTELGDFENNDLGGNFKFEGGKLKFLGFHADLTYPARYTQIEWSGLPASGWNHYAIHKKSGVVNFYINGALNTNKVKTVISDIGGTGTGTDDIALYAKDINGQAGRFTWTLGLIAANYNAYPGQLNNPQYFTGSITQFAAWWGTVPDVSVNMYKLYDSGYVDLGSTGTATGLPAPKVYLRLNAYNDGTNLGTVSAATWHQVQTTGSNHNAVFYNNYTAFTPTSGMTTTGYLPGIVAKASLTFDGIIAVTTGAALNSTATLIANVKKNTGTAVTLNSTATFSITPTVIKKTTVHLDAFATELAITTRVARTLVDLQSRATVTIATSNDLQTSANLSSQSIMTVSVDRVQNAAADLTSTFTQTNQVKVTKDFQSTMEVITDEIANATKLVKYQADLHSNTTLTAYAYSSQDNVIIEAGTFTMDVQANRIRETIVDLQAFATELSLGSILVKFEAHLQAFNTQLTIGTRFRLDPCLQLKIEPETLLLAVNLEPRLVTIDSETRTRRIKSEPRLLIVDFEDRVNIIKGCTQ